MKTVIIIAAAMIIGIILVFFATGILLPSLNDIPSGNSDQYALVQGSRIRFRVYEKGGQPIIFLHGFGGDLTDWERLVQSLTCGKAFILDLIGFGLSDRPDIDYNLATQSKYLISFMDKIGIDKATLVGTSMGASISLWTAANYPDRIDAICAFAPSAYPGTMHHNWPGDLLYRPNIINRFLGGLTSTSIYNFIFPKSLARQALNMTGSYDKTFIQALKKIKQPTLLVWSKKDPRVAYEYSSIYREIIPQAKFVQAPDKAGHRIARYPIPEISEWLCKTSRGLTLK